MVLLSVVALCVEDKGIQGQWEDNESIKTKRTSSKQRRTEATSVLSVKLFLCLIMYPRPDGNLVLVLLLPKLIERVENCRWNALVVMLVDTCSLLLVLKMGYAFELHIPDFQVDN